jgi:hypothetical protein
MNAHADASPSSSSIWINCPASVTLARGKVRKSTPYTREGSAAHTLAEMRLKGQNTYVLGQKILVEGDQIEVTEEMLQAVQTYVTECTVAAKGASAVGIEARVGIVHDGEDVFGTVDHYAFQEPVLKITDFKYGQGVPVSPDSSQLKIYALGVINELGPFAEVKEVVLKVVQPRIGGIGIHAMDYPDLVRWETDVLHPAMDRLAANDTTENTGEHCRWCVRAGECRAFADLAMDKARVAFGTAPPSPTGFSDAELGDILSHAELINAWVVKVRAEVSGRIDNGHKVPGWKLVAKRAVRKIINEIGALNAVIQKGIPWDEVTRVETLGVLEKVMKKHGVDLDTLDPFVAKESSGTTLVEENNSRPAIATDPQSVFN